MWNKVTLKYNNTKMHQSLQEDEGLLSYIWKSTFINSTSRYLKSICWLNATTSELCLLFTKLRASHTTRVGWEGGIYVSTYFKISRSGWEILPIALCPYINFALFFTFNFVSKLPPTPYPPFPPANQPTTPHFGQKFASKMLWPSSPWRC